MHLTRIPINRNSRGGTKLLGNAQAMHAAVEGCFPPGANPEGAGRPLWRVDRIGHHTYLYIVAASRPDPISIIEQGGWPAADGPGYETRGYSEPLEELRAGQTFTFRVEVNATHSPFSLPGDRRSKRAPVRGDENLVAWLIARGPRIGATIDTARVVSNIKDEVARDKNSPILNRTAFVGTLTVTDADLLRDALITGIGPSKAYGCGLLTLAPAQ